MNIEKPINRFVCFCLEGSKRPPDQGELLVELDLLIVSTNIGEFEYDDKEYPVAPDVNPAELRKMIESRFPFLECYCTADGKPETIDKSQVIVGDPIDYLVDIIMDLKDVQWYLENTSIENAAWDFQFNYRGHWGLHARELQLLLHRHWW